MNLKKFFGVIGVVILCAVVACNASSLTGSWTYNYASNPACTASLTENCVTGFAVLDVTNPASPITLATIPNSSNDTGSVTVTTIISVGAPYGLRSFASIANGKDMNGNAVVSSQSNVVSATVGPDAPANFAVTVK